MLGDTVETSVLETRSEIMLQGTALGREARTGALSGIEGATERGLIGGKGV